MSRVLAPNLNCCPLVKAPRFALLVDAANYYETLAQAIAQAEQTVALVGWDLDSRARLGPGAGPGRLVPPLHEFLPAAADANPGLNIYLLTWDFPLLLATVRDPELVWGRDPFNHPRVHLKFDSTHPPGGSHHQKIVVIDDCLAFAGGMDIAGGRWDTSEHRADDVRRPGEDGPYPPYHDVQAMVDGDAARALSAIVRDRWRRATGTSIPDPVRTRTFWPDRVPPDLVDVTVGISRTDAGVDGRGGCREIERLHLDLIDAARDSIYIENQYLTSATIVTALCRRLEVADGPEVVLVLPLNNAGWLEEHTIEVLRIRCIRQLRRADRFGHLRICYPAIPGLDDEQSVGVHSKVLVVDDRWFRVGSSNLTNRSMRLDTECDLTIEATGPSQRSAISSLRNRLLGEHLGMPAGDVASHLSRDPSLVRLIDSRRAHPRCLRELPLEDRLSELIVEEEIVDPSQPITPGLVMEALATSTAQHPVKRLLPLVVFCAAMTAAAVALWRALRTRSVPPSR